MAGCRVTSAERRVLERLEGNRSSLYISEIAAGAKLTQRQALKALLALQEAGRIESTWKLPRRKV